MTRRCWLALLVAMSMTPLAFAVIAAPIPLKNCLADNEFIFVAKVESIDAGKGTMVLNVQEDLKGKIAFRRLPVKLDGDADAKKLDHIPQLLKRLAPELPTVWFVYPKGKRLTAFVFTNGTWMQILGTREEKDRAVWNLAHGEPYLRGTFKGTTAELIETIKDGLSGKKAPPDDNPKEPPGFGPELPQKKALRDPFDGGLNRGGPLFAVIAPVGLLAPIAILAVLFPTVFGGVLILFRQWTAFITALSLNSTLYLLHLWKGSVWFRNSWWNTEPALWSAMTIVTLLCLLWAWRRQLHNLTQGIDALETPTRTEFLILSVLSITCAGFVAGTWWLEPPNWRNVLWNYTIVVTVATVGGLTYKVFRGAFEVMLPMATEGVMLGAAMVAHLVVFATYSAFSTGDRGTVSNLSAESTAPKLLGERWRFETRETGLFISSPLVDGNKVFAASAHPTFKGGTLFCFDVDTGKKKYWEFFDDGDLKQVFSSPIIADGKIFLGEGFHGDPGCKLYAIDAQTGSKIWEHKTDSQTEATPVFAGGKIYEGCGNDGFYCFAADAKDIGRALWQFPPKGATGRLLRFGAGAVVHSGRVFVGTGVDRYLKEDKGETAFFAFDAETGKNLWKIAMPLPVWAAPAIFDDRLFVAIGNGDVFSDDELAPAGAVYCLDPKNGNELWKTDLPNGVLQKPAVDDKHIYVACRDSQCYALHRTTGKIAWTADLGSPGVATPALARSSKGGDTVSVIAVGTKGKLVCLNPHTGAADWTYSVAKSTPMTLGAAPAVLVRAAVDGSEQRLIFLGAGDVGSSTQATLICLEDRVPAK